jgi:hypothetical protein
MHFGQPLPRRRGRLLDVWLDLGTRVKRRSSGCRHCGRLRRDCRGEHRRRHDGRFRRIELDLVRPFLRGVDAGDRPLGCRLRGAIPGLHRRRARPHPIRHEEQRDQHAPDVHKIPSDGHHVYVPLHSRQCDHETNARGCICSKRSQHVTFTRFVAGSTVCHRGHDKVTLQRNPWPARCSKLERRLVSHVCREGGRLYPEGAHHEPEKRR